MWYA
jgi:transposase-like protein